jgi:APA family basic amino acid/polyamine antiporter
VETPLKRTLGLWSVTLSGVGVIVGAGVYVLIGAVAGEAGNASWLSFLAAGVVAAFTASSYARFAAMRPLDSPEFQYTRMAFGLRAGFVAGWLVIWADLVAVAVVALGFAGYLEQLTGVPRVAGALGLAAACTALTLWGIGQSVKVAIVFTALEVAGLVGVIAVGAGSLGSVNYLEMPHGLTGVFGGAALAFFAFLGFDELGNLAEETREPQRTLPRALALAVVISTVIYLLVAVAAVSAVGWERLSQSDAPLALVVSSALGESTGTVLSVIALAATGNTVLLLLISASRALYGMASAGALPGSLSKVGRTGTPWQASLAALAVVAAFIAVGRLEAIARLTDAAVLVPFAVVNIALFWVLARAPGSRVALVPPLVGTALCLALFVHTGAWNMLAVAGFAAVGGLFALRLRGGRAGEP